MVKTLVFQGFGCSWWELICTSSRRFQKNVAISNLAIFAFQQKRAQIRKPAHPPRNALGLFFFRSTWSWRALRSCQGETVCRPAGLESDASVRSEASTRLFLRIEKLAISAVSLGKKGDMTHDMTHTPTKNFSFHSKKVISTSLSQTQGIHLGILISIDGTSAGAFDGRFAVVADFKTAAALASLPGRRSRQTVAASS